MSVDFADIFAALAAPFDGRNQVKVRQQAGRQLSYITARTAMNRLDEVLGPSNWWDDYVPHEHSVLCRLTIRLPDGTTLTKADAGGYAGMSDQGDDDKSGYSDAFKRACVKFGVARYLYQDGVPDFGGDHQPAPPRQQAAPSPRPAPPPNGAPPARPSQRPGPPPQQQQGGRDDAPRSGRALFAWTKKQEEQHNVALLDWLNAYIKEMHGGKRMVDLDDRQVAEVHAEGVRRLDELNGTAQAPAAGDEDIPFDRASAWRHLLERAEAIAGHLFGESADGTDAQSDAALASLDAAVPDHLRVADWRRCSSRESFAAYYKAAGEVMRQYSEGSVLR